MRNNQISINAILILNILLILNLSFSYIIFPFSTIKENKKEYMNINPDVFSYNYKNFFDDNFNELIYINMTLGNPNYEIKVALTYEESNFKIRNISECINYNIYSSQQININAYTDINLNNKQNFENINFSLYNSYTSNNNKK